MRRIKKCAEISERTEVWIDVEIIGNVVTVITLRRGIKRQEPDSRNAEFLEIIELLDQATEVAHPIAIAVTKRLNVQFIDDRVFVPKRIDRRITEPLRHAANLCRSLFGWTSRPQRRPRCRTCAPRVSQPLPMCRCLCHLSRQLTSHADFELCPWNLRRRSQRPPSTQWLSCHV